MLQFGTDGIRGDADADLTSDLVVALGRAAAVVLGTDRPFVVGRDTRRSGPRLRDDLAAGLHAEGAVLRDAGIVPTPAVAFLAAVDGLPALMISASHNPWTDNGIKLFAPGGRKLDDALERRVEDELRARVGAVAARAWAEPDGAISHEPYVQHLVRTIEGRRLDGLRVVVDGANGAASELGPEVLRALGAEVVVIHAAPDGTNINAGCGSTAPGNLQAAVVAEHADAGLAFDGDADRVLAVDERGALVDGDQIMVIVALDLHARGRLRNDAIAVTVLSNLGLRNALAAAGVSVVETPVGDRHVFAAMEAGDLLLGGEQSGHVIFRELATTGDGILTGLQLLDSMARSGRRMSELAAQMTRVPQLLEGVRVAAKPDLAAAPGLAAEVEAVEAALGAEGRVLVRASGTEPLIRIMVEAPTEAAARGALARLRAATEKEFGASGGGR
jgi:phosphoglucosamine mutase